MNNQIEDNIDEEKLNANLNAKAMSRRNSSNNIYIKGSDNLSVVEKNSAQGMDLYSNNLYGKNDRRNSQTNVSLFCNKTKSLEDWQIPNQILCKIFY